MTLLSPWFLLGLLGLGLPLWLHLLQRQNPVKLPFSSLMFMERRQQSSLKERRLRYLLLLGARLAVLSLLALAFAKPVWERPPAAMAGALPRLHLIVLDTSMSMSHGGRWERAVAAAQTIVNGLDSRDRAQILTNGPGVSIITQPTADKPELRAALASLSLGASRNSYRDAIEAVRSLTSEADTAVTVHLISDFQQSAMPGRFADLQLPTAVTLEPHDVAQDSDHNWAIEAVKGTTRLWGAKQPKLEATVAGYAAPPTTRRVHLSINGERVSTQTVEVPEHGRVSATFEAFEVPMGFSRVEVSLEPGDDLPVDDVRLLALDNSEPKPILFLTADSRQRDALYYRAALDASSSSAFRIESASPGQADRLSPDTFAFVVISDVPRLSTGFQGRLRNYVENGGAAFVAIGANIATEGRIPLIERPIRSYRSSRDDAFRFLLAGEVEESHPALGQVERFRSVKFFRHARIEAREDDDVLARLADGSPLLLEERLGQGRVLVFASTFDNIWNDLPVHPLFVPFVVETARYLSGVDDGMRQAIVDSVLELRRGASTSSAVQVYGPGGERALTLSGSVTEQDVSLTQIGFYELRRPGSTELVAVNPDPRESNLLPMEADLIAMWKSTGRSAEAGSTESEASAIQPPPIRIWRFLLLLLLLGVLLESIVGNWHFRVRREV